MLASRTLITRSLKKDKQAGLFLLVKMAVSSTNALDRPVLKSSHSLQFYRRPLPSTCIDFASLEGKTIFSEALATGHMNSFFKLSSQYRTQDEPAYCGLTSLVMALNVLEIDPGRVWKGPWRWYHEDMLDCCTSLQMAREKGINMEQFICLARCNNLAVNPIAGSNIQTLEELREQVKATTLRDDVVFVASYSRKTMGQTGDGHFSPIAGYHEGRDLVLILDTARFKYPPHWVSLQILLDAMKTVDPDTGRSRGYVILSRAKNQPSLLLFRPSPALKIEKDKCSSQILQFSKDWSKYLNTKLVMKADQKDVVEIALSHLKDLKCKNFLSLAFFGLTLHYEIDKFSRDSFIVQCPQLSKADEKVTCLIKNLITELESLETFKAVREFFLKQTLEEKSEFLSFLQTEGVSCDSEAEPAMSVPAISVSSFLDATSCCSKDVSEKCNIYKRLRNEAAQKESSTDKTSTCTDCEGTFNIGPEHAVTLFLQVWPHMSSKSCEHVTLVKDSSPGSSESSQAPPKASDDAAPSQEGLPLGFLLKEYVSSDLSKAGGKLIMDEINAIKVKIGEVFAYHGQCGLSKCCAR